MTKTPAFYTVSMGKFSLLYFASQGLFGTVWFYQQWLHQLQHQNQHKATTTHPALLHGAAVFRAIFAVFFVFDLLHRLHRHEYSLQQHYPWNPKALSLVFIGVQLFHVFISLKIPSPNPSQWWQLPIAFILLANYYLMYKVQLVANRVNLDPFGQQNNRLTPLNTGFMVSGLYFWFLYFSQWLQ